MNQKIKIAVCLSGQIRSSPEVVSINKHKLDEFALKYNLDIDYFCHFWNQNDRYPYQIDRNLLENQIDKLDIIDTDSEWFQTRVLKSLNPKKVKFSTYNEMLPEIQRLHFYSNTGLFNEVHNNYISKSYFNEDIEKFCAWGKLHVYYCNIIKQLAQFYSFEQSVSLVKEYSMRDDNNVYDIIMRLRYDTMIVDQDLEPVITAVYKAIDKNSIIVNDIRKYPGDGSIIYDRQTRVKRNRKHKTDMGEFGVADTFFLGSAASMILLVNDLYTNVSKNYAYNVHDIAAMINFTPEMLWFKEIENKGIPCECSIETSLSSGVLVVRNFDDIKFDDYGVINQDSFKLLSNYVPAINKYQSLINESIIDTLTDLFYKMYPELKEQTP